MFSQQQDTAKRHTRAPNWTQKMDNIHILQPINQMSNQPVQRYQHKYSIQNNQYYSAATIQRNQ